RELLRSARHEPEPGVAHGLPDGTPGHPSLLHVALPQFPTCRSLSFDPSTMRPPTLLDRSPSPSVQAVPCRSALPSWLPAIGIRAAWLVGCHQHPLVLANLGQGFLEACHLDVEPFPAELDGDLVWVSILAGTGGATFAA